MNLVLNYTMTLKFYLYFLNKLFHQQKNTISNNMSCHRILQLLNFYKNLKFFPHCICLKMFFSLLYDSLPEDMEALSLFFHPERDNHILKNMTFFLRLHNVLMFHVLFYQLKNTLKLLFQEQEQKLYIFFSSVFLSAIFLNYF